MKRIFIYLSLAGLVLTVTATGAVGSVLVDEEEIVFRLDAPGAERVFVVGDFNGWNPTIDRLIMVEGLFEIRLYLVPGRYRYRFIVDGESISDPDNPALDADGNSVFHLAETPAGLSVAMGEAAMSPSGVEESISVTAELSALAGDYRDAFNAAARIEGRSGESVEARLTVGYEAVVRDDEVRRGDLLFTRAAGSYSFDRGRIEAFTRDADLDFHDPASLFGSSGIYRYPVGSLCRGLLYEGRLPLGIQGKAFYASRLAGPGGGLELRDAAPLGILFDAREMADADITGLRLGSKLWRTRFAYLMRRDRRPFPAPWAVSDPSNVYFTGYERVLVDGVLLSLEGDAPITFEVELLKGESRLSSLERYSAAAWGEPYEVEALWQEGSRLHTALRYAGERVGLRLAVDRTVLEGPHQIGRGSDRSERLLAGGAADISAPFGDIGVRGGMERYGSGSGGALFWLRERNFFLDGDDITPGRLPFIESDELYELEIRIAQPAAPEEAHETLEDGRRAWGFEPFALPLTLSYLERWESGGDRFSEVRFSKGADLHRRVRFFVDARYVSYDVEGWSGESNFLDVYLALRGTIRENAWISLGLGVNPSVYDNWLYRYTGYGRERYLVDKGLLEAGIGREDLLVALERAERALSEEWSISFEAYVRFW